ncbi:hypothetical protein, partial [Pseudoalteromonas sp. GABNS16H]|uniref:hypothetical protein n=1 Tax=Pseudoalteromonas sp. GABNS16H TaxID=3025325 RepID=UPI0023630EC0
MIRDGWLEEAKPPETNQTVHIIIHAFSVCQRSRGYRPEDSAELPITIETIKTYYDFYQPPVDKRTLANCIFQLD